MNERFNEIYRELHKLDSALSECKDQIDLLAAELHQEEIHDLLNNLLDEKASNEAKKKGIVKFKRDDCVSFMMNKKAYIGCLAKDLLSTDKIVEFHLYTDVDSDKAVFCSLHGDTPQLHVNFDDITNIRNSQDSEIALLALNCAENELFFDKKTHKLFPYKIKRAKKRGSYYSIFMNNNSLDILPCTDRYSDIDDMRFLEGRYFLSKDNAIDFITSCYEYKLKERSIL